MIKIIEGDILKASENIIGHQVNCQGVMGAGLAKQLRDNSKVLYNNYRSLCNRANPYDLLGTVQIVCVAKDKYVANIFGQLNYGRQKLRYTDYDELRKALEDLKRIAIKEELSVALPYGIGCGLAGGDWDVVSSIIKEVFSNFDITLYKFN